jgi:hypothetical protein
MRRSVGPGSLPFLLILALGAEGCLWAPAYMKPVQADNLKAPPDRARVVFIRHSGFFGGAIPFTIMDAEGHYLGDSIKSSHFSVLVPPGHHIFISCAENTAEVDTNLAAGKTYFLEVALRPGFGSARTDLLALKPGVESWPDKDKWIQETDALEADTQAGQAHLDENPDNKKSRAEDAIADVKKYSAEDALMHTLKPGDGI